MIATNTATVPFFDQHPRDKIALNTSSALAATAASVLKQALPEVTVVEPSMLQRPQEAIQQPVAPPEEPLPENYATLPQNSKLDEEPNPFEKSFSGLPPTAAQAAKNPSPPVAKPVLPPVTSMDSPSSGIPTFKKATVDQFAWGSLRAGPLSPSMLQGPVNNALVPFTATPATAAVATTIKPVEADEFVPYQPQIPTSMQYSFQANTQPAHVNGTKYGVYQQPAPIPQSVKPTPQAQHITTFPIVPQPEPYGQDQAAVKAEARPYQSTTEFIHHDNGGPTRKGSRSTHQQIMIDSKPTTRTKRQEHGELLEGLGPTNKRQKSVSSEQDEDEKRRNFLERNRQAALKCRQRKKAWLSDLQGKVEILAQENEQLTEQANSFREEIIQLKSLLLAHKECQVTKDNGSSIRVALEKPIPPPIAATSQRHE